MQLRWVCGWVHVSLMSRSVAVFATNLLRLPLLLLLLLLLPLLLLPLLLLAQLVDWTK